MKERHHQKGRFVPFNHSLAQKAIVVAIGGALLLQPLQSVLPLGNVDVVAAASSTAATQLKNANMSMTEQTRYPIASGVQRIDYRWTPAKGSGTVNVHVIEIDLSNPYVQLNAMSGKGSTVANLSNVLNMAKENGAVAAVNADVFQTGSSSDNSPMGPQITSGTLMSGPMQLKGMYSFGVTKSKTPSVDLYSFDGTLTAEDGSTFPIAGMNESAYRTEPNNGYSHANAIYVYTSAWTAATRPKDSNTTPTEVLVRNGKVAQITKSGETLPMQPPADGYILRAHGTAAKFINEHLTVGSAVNADYSLVSQTTGQKIDTASYQMMVGGHTILVDNGKAATFSRDITGVSGSSAVYRTAVGYTKDEKKVLMITAEGTSTRNGMSLKELQEAMVALGVWKGIDLDGGGSTTMVERPLGEFTLKTAHPTTGGSYLRPVANGIGVFSTAPKGKLEGLLPSGANTLFIGQSADYSLKAYDNYYNPVDASSLKAQWKATGNIGMFSGASFSALKSGQGTIQVSASGVTGQLPINVIGADQIANMTIDASSGSLESGTQIKATVKIVTKDGLNYTVPSESIKWEFQGFSADANGNSFTINKVNNGAAVGYAIARYDGYPVMLTLTQGSSSAMWETFEKVAYGITFESTDGASGGVQLTSGLSGKPSSTVLQLRYDFTKGIGSGKTLAAYAALNGTGRQVSGTPSGMELDAYGDNSFNWLRMEVKDNSGKLVYIDLAKSINWTGWKTLKVDFSSYGLAYPITIKRFYVANIAQDQDERNATGVIALDDITMLYPPSLPALERPFIKLELNQKAATIGSTPVKLDVAPIALNGVTYLPLVFIADAMGAKVGWDSADKRVTVIRGDRMLEMRIGSKDIIVDGVRQPATAAPIIREGRTLVPLRLISEQLGLKVGFDGATKSVTVE
ncbi:stalk domain-containing protein [Paenibacillus sp. MMS18-CY102]|uniref:stalk domain-containing protein n=1 Tax=Paenibacillus sp. MMS18-CY102 TaxID=2682849 RepID=UPI00136550BA|nr:stalk domain-containing protein [Paenibacillus sp. MMS18-CY102]MWC27201.1 copper amine oxidase [Paenibacillus sp. MMS18-CY102]